MSIENRIKEARKFAGFSQKSLADKLAITGRTLQRYEKDASKMPIEIAKNISFLCAVDLSWLLTGEEQMREKSDTNPDSVKGNVARVLLHSNNALPPSSKLLPKSKDPYSSGKIPPIGKDPYDSGKIPNMPDIPEDSPLDYDLLKEIITATEKYLFENQLELSPSKKAELIIILYEQFDEAENGFEYGTFERFMRLAAQ
jgi:transcriptional regulator with XRE-family HTH domain